MLAGELYDPNDPALMQARRRTRRLCWQYNGINPDESQNRAAILAELFGSLGAGSEIVAPFYCDYGCHIRAGTGVFMNFDCVVLDCSWVAIGDRVLMGPGVHIYAATHPLEPEARAAGRELARPVTIGSDVWIGGGAILCPGIRIGAGTTIGAGSVITRDIPENVFAAGNPCRVVRELAAGDARSDRNGPPQL